jgi:hypothetical protein
LGIVMILRGEGKGKGNRASVKKAIKGEGLVRLRLGRFLDSDMVMSFWFHSLFMFLGLDFFT